MTDSSQPYTSAMAPRVMRLLAELERSPVGRTVCDHVREVLEAYEAEVTGARDSGLALLGALLDAWLSRLAADTPEAAELRMLRLRLEQLPGPGETPGLLRRIRSLSADRGMASPAPSEAPQVSTPAAEAAPPVSLSIPTEPAAAPVPTAAETAPKAPAPAAAEEELPYEDTPDSGRRVDLTYRKHLAEKRERIQRIQETLVQQVNEVIAQNEKFGVLLEVEHESLRHADSIEELEGLKAALVGEVGKLREGHQTLARKLDTASKYLQIIGTEGQHLNDELTRVHILSLTDELTDLPNRRAFLRRLEDEVARVQRYGYPLSLALIDMDSFKSVNDKYGHGAGDEVLRNFAANILSIFRHHDMVARYGGEEFAVLLPNTDKNGAQRALEKVKKRTSESSYQFGGKTMAMPTFSAGISLYKPGETPGNLIERADKALYQAKRLGRNRIELAQHDGAEASVR